MFYLMSFSINYAGLVEQAYHPDNCYHNCTHAADVTQALHCLISEPKVTRQTESDLLHLWFPTLGSFHYHYGFLFLLVINSLQDM